MKTAKRFKRHFKIKLPNIKVTLKVVKPTCLSFIRDWLDYVTVVNDPHLPEDPEVRKMLDEAHKPKSVLVRIGPLDGEKNFEHTAKISLRSPYESC